MRPLWSGGKAPKDLQPSLCHIVATISGCRSPALALIPTKVIQWLHHWQTRHQWRLQTPQSQECNEGEHKTIPLSPQVLLSIAQVPPSGQN